MKYRVSIITASDSSFNGKREDISAEVIKKIILEEGYEFASYTLLPDEKDQISKKMAEICDNNIADLILTTGGTGFSVRDVTPEATMQVVQRLVPGIPEAMRSLSMQITKRAMLSRAVSGIRQQTLIINLPGSPKAVEECLMFILPEVKHGLDILTGNDSNCAKI